MSKPITFNNLVPAEIQSAIDWYEEMRPGLGHEFVAVVKDIFMLIAVHPELYGRYHGNIRAAFLERFPYAIYYYILPNTIRVTAIQHTARDDSNWKHRK